jgi:arylformamidase
MQFDQITDWDTAYENTAHIAGGAGYPARWMAQAQAYRDAARTELDIPYGDGPRNTYDLFLPDAEVRGLCVFVHGGYWMAFDKSVWSAFARGPVARGWAVAIPSYDLCPDASIAQITAQIGAAITHAAAAVHGPVVLAGHSAGGHLVASMMCTDTPLPSQVMARLRRVVSISGVHDMRPMVHTTRNETLGLTLGTATAASPALKLPVAGVPVTAWVGGAERQEFLRQSALLANIWRGLGCHTTHVVDPDRHHFTVIDGLADPASDLCAALLD